MSSRRESLRLADIVENVDHAAEYVEGLSLGRFVADRKTVDAVERCLERLTEAAIKVGDMRMAVIAPDLPMHRVRALGNALRHAYDRIDLKAIYDTVHDDLPKRRTACLAVLGASA